MRNQEALRDVLAVRHSLQVNPRLRLEFMASVSKLLRDHHVEAGEELLRSVVLAIPEELMNGNGNGSHQLLAQRVYKAKSQKAPKPPQPKPPKPPSIPPSKPKPPKPPKPAPPPPPSIPPPKPPKPPKPSK